MTDELSSAQTTSGGPVQDATGTLVDQSKTTTTETTSSQTQTAQEGTDSTKIESTTDAAKAAGAPEKYEPFKAPEGLAYTDETFAEASKIFKELNLSQEAGQKLMDTFGAKLTEATNDAYNSYQQTRADWRSEVIKDPALGNGSDNLKPEVKAAIGRVIDNGLGAELGLKFREAMDFTGAGDNPAFIRGMLALSKFITEGSAVKAGGPVAPAAKKPSAAQSMYPNLPSAAG